MKKCSKCGVEKDLDEFSKNKLKKDGLQSYCKDCKGKIDKQWNELNSNYKKLKDKEYRNSHKQDKAEYMRNRSRDKLLFKLSNNIRCLIRVSFNRSGFSKDSKTQKILGCTFEEFKVHIENQFVDGMGWDNRGLWHLDHIYPVSKAVDEEHLIQLNHYTNFQPLWAEDNIRKGNKLPEYFI